MAIVCVMVSDLIFSSKIRSTAQTLEVELVVARTQEKLQAEIAAVGLLIVDLNLEGDDPIEMIRTAAKQENPPHIIAFCSHVQTELADAARQAGADAVWPRSKFVLELPAILTGTRKPS